VHIEVQAADVARLQAALERFVTTASDPSLFRPRDESGPTTFDASPPLRSDSNVDEVLRPSGGTVRLRYSIGPAHDHAVPPRALDAGPRPASSRLFHSPFARLFAVLAAALVIGTIAGIVRAQRASTTSPAGPPTGQVGTASVDTGLLPGDGGARAGQGISTGLAGGERQAQTVPPPALEQRPKSTARIGARGTTPGTRATGNTVRGSASGAKAVPSVGEIEVTSRPSGAKVSVDNHSAGKTPLILENQPVGNHSLRIDRRGYEKSNTTIIVRSGKRTKVNVSLNKKK
jgi:hypothetical protein